MCEVKCLQTTQMCEQKSWGKLREELRRQSDYCKFLVIKNRLLNRNRFLKWKAHDFFKLLISYWKNEEKKRSDMSLLRSLLKIAL